MIGFIFKYKKVIALVAGASALAAGIYMWNQNTYQRGVLDERMRFSELHNQILDEQRQQYEKAAQEAIQLQQIELEEELARVRAEAETKTEIKEVVRYVETEIEVPADCDALATNVSRVLKQATNIVRSATTTSARDTN